MSDRNLILTLAKVIIAAAWADGEVKRDEINTLTELLSRLPHAGLKRGLQVTGREWAILEMYMDAPVDADELARLIAELQAALRRPADRALAISALEELIQADGVVTEEERALVEEIKSSLEAVDLSIVGQLGRLIRGPIQRHAQVPPGVPNREKYLQDFINNKIYYVLRWQRKADIPGWEMDEPALRQLCLAGGLLALVAHVDREIKNSERQVMRDVLQSRWNVPPKAAATVVDIAAEEAQTGLDAYRLAREFYADSTERERHRLVEDMFAVANADAQISHAEQEEIRPIATILKLTQKQFIRAKLKSLGK